MNNLLDIINVEDIESFSLTIKKSFVYEEDLCELGFYPKETVCNREGKLHRITWERKNENNVN